MQAKEKEIEIDNVRNNNESHKQWHHLHNEF